MTASTAAPRTPSSAGMWRRRGRRVPTGGLDGASGAEMVPVTTRGSRRRRPPSARRERNGPGRAHRPVGGPPSRDRDVGRDLGPGGARADGPRRRARGQAGPVAAGDDGGELFPDAGRAPAAAVPPVVRTAVWTDGACRGNPGPGGWA